MTTKFLNTKTMCVLYFHSKESVWSNLIGRWTAPSQEPSQKTCETIDLLDWTKLNFEW